MGSIDMTNAVRTIAAYMGWPMWRVAREIIKRRKGRTSNG